MLASFDEWDAVVAYEGLHKNEHVRGNPQEDGSPHLTNQLVDDKGVFASTALRGKLLEVFQFQDREDFRAWCRNPQQQK
jgi:hypothetical protein